MECAAVQELLNDLNRGRLESGLGEAVRAHVAGCTSCAHALNFDAELRARLRAEAPRYAASPALRARLQVLAADIAPAPGPVLERPGGWRGWIARHPWPVATLAGAVAVVLLAWAGWLWLARDPVSLLAARAIDEHAEYAKRTMSRSTPDPQAVVQDLKRRLGYALDPVFPGDSHLQLVGGSVSDLPGRRAAALIYRDPANRYTTLYLMPEGGIDVPREGRLSIEKYTPHHRVVSGRQLLLWKQRGLACLIVSDMDEAGTAAAFLKIRKAA